jgi:hypothetical protein
MGGWKSAEMVRRYAHLATAQMARNAAAIMLCFTSQLRHSGIPEQRKNEAWNA